MKVEIVKMMAEREGYSKENETLRQYRVAFQQLQQDNENLHHQLQELKLPISSELKLPISSELKLPISSDLKLPARWEKQFFGYLAFLLTKKNIVLMEVFNL